MTNIQEIKSKKWKRGANSRQSDYGRNSQNPHNTLIPLDYLPSIQSSTPSYASYGPEFTERASTESIKEHVQNHMDDKESVEDIEIRK